MLFKMRWFLIYCFIFVGMIFANIYLSGKNLSMKKDFKDKEDLLCQAIYEKDIKKVKEALDLGFINLNFKCNKATPLSFASFLSQKEEI